MAALLNLQVSGPASVRRLGLESQPNARVQAPRTPGVEDDLELSSRALELSRQRTVSAEPRPVFGRFQLGGPEPLPFGPDLNASILNRIPGEGIRTPANGVQLGHQPARGLNILA
jgi:hypothetical protein